MVTNSVNADHDMRRQRFHESAVEERDHRAQDRFRIRGSKSKFLIAWLTLLGAATAEERLADPAWRVWLEPTFMHARATVQIPDAKTTEFAAGFREGDELIYFLEPQFRSLKSDWNKFIAQARVNADLDFKGVGLEYVRDRKKVIEYAVLRCEQPVMASAVLASKFLDQFKDTLGEKVLIAVPNRYTAYVFPQLASDYREYAPMVLKAYRATAYPVSVEVFEVGVNSFRAIGVYEEP